MKEKGEKEKGGGRERALTGKGGRGASRFISLAAATSFRKGREEGEGVIFGFPVSFVSGLTRGRATRFCLLPVSKRGETAGSSTSTASSRRRRERGGGGGEGGEGSTRFFPS